ncbi:Gfo/Idh/MocA family protein [Rathayibacter sp. VKM Ac-2927]|uniref:Gfo/Idh/MocA family protein n=1 Tax=Rathayibacter sp. VKM Ac-2927 TaxID=2929478 RepID=UPI001FB2C4ED|nr:Gfo/Idh/MocA family oxidoreductase [Rathayibacter sp. VKM Ac-2927]MCJ1688350.1 Gfo/Idh/MocA family oxidoreductase [Rathayibacter sp. VKM Ac-2927]
MTTSGPLRQSAASRTNGVAAPRRSRFAVIGAGWRSTVYLDLARARPDLFEVTGVLARRPEEAARSIGRDVALVSDVDGLLATRPEFVVVSVPWAVTPTFLRELVGRGVPVLAETPPAPDLEGLRALWRDVGTSGLVAVAEQYPRYPLTAAIGALVAEGAIGEPSFVHVSSTHEYHAVAMIRGLLGAGRGRVQVTAQSVVAPLLDPLDPGGWTDAVEPGRAVHTLASLVFENGTRGLYDFTDNQWWNPLRPDRLTVRGSLGEVHDDVVVRMIGPTASGSSRLERGASGRGLNLEGADTTTVSFDGRILYRNRFEGGRFSDDELAVAGLVAEAGEWARGAGPSPYSLAEACQDHAVALAIRRAAVEGPLLSDREDWA